MLLVSEISIGRRRAGQIIEYGKKRVLAKIANNKHMLGKVQENVFFLEPWFHVVLPRSYNTQILVKFL